MMAAAYSQSQATSTFTRTPAKAPTSQPVSDAAAALSIPRKLKHNPAIRVHVVKDPAEFDFDNMGVPLPPAQKRLIESVKRPGTWGGEVELNGLAAMLGVTIKVCAVNKVLDNDLEKVEASVIHTVNTDGKKVIHVTYDGEHYNALQVPEGDIRREDRTVVGCVGRVPGDGDCMFHAVAEAANVSGSLPVSNIYRYGQLSFLRQPGTWLARAVPNMANRSDSDVYHAFRRAVADALRLNLADHLRRPEYAFMAQMAETGGF